LGYDPIYMVLVFLCCIYISYSYALAVSARTDIPCVAVGINICKYNTLSFEFTQLSYFSPLKTRATKN
jgi:hypothetical protein